MTDPADYGYVNARRSGKLVFISGQIGINPDGTTPKDPAEQYRLAFAELGKVLQAEGLLPKDIVEIGSYHVRFPEHMEIFIAVKKEFLGDSLPAWTGVGVDSVGGPGSLVEIRAIAELP